MELHTRMRRNTYKPALNPSRFDLKYVLMIQSRASVRVEEEEEEKVEAEADGVGRST